VDAGFFTAPNPRAPCFNWTRAGKSHGILITHEHSDHIAGLLGIADKFQIPVYCTATRRTPPSGLFKNNGARKPTSPSKTADTFKSKINWQFVHHRREL